MACRAESDDEQIDELKRRVRELERQLSRDQQPVRDVGLIEFAPVSQ